MSNVVKIGDLQIARQRRQWGAPPGVCQHLSLTWSEHGDIIDCDDCGKQVSAQWVVAMLCERWDREVRKLQASQQAVDRTLSAHVVLRAAKKVEAAWRRRNMLPACPHCGEAIAPEDGLGGSMVNREIAMRRRAIRTGEPEPRP